jgi:hypothetical protein
MKRLVALIVALAFPFLFTDGASAMAYDCHSHDIDIAPSESIAIYRIYKYVPYMFEPLTEYQVLKK